LFLIWVQGNFSRTAASLAVNDRFVIVKSSFERQYAQMYFLRLTKMRQALQARAQAVWPASEGLVHVNSIRDIPTDRECAVVGTVFKEMKNRPCILDEYDKVKSNAAKARTLHTSPDDSLILEDDTGRIRLANQPDSTVLDIKSLVSGPVIALRGTVNAAGVFVVRESCYANVPPQSPLAAPSAASAPRFLCLVSGLHIGDGTVDPLPRQLFADFVCGFLGTSSDQRCSASIQQVIIAGNLLSTFDSEAEAGQSKQAAITKAARPLVECDAVLSQLCSAAPVLLMPGDSDPANYTMPQQPLHACMFKRAATFSTFRSTTNPCDVRVDDTHVIGTSGQNISDMVRFNSYFSILILHN
jgi:DNA polymerase delta subunit 2